jgi:hypothetical protein
MIGAGLESRDGPAVDAFGSINSLIVLQTFLRYLRASRSLMKERSSDEESQMDSKDNLNWKTDLSSTLLL